VDVGFWQQQVDDLLTGIGALGGMDAPLDTPTPDPTLPPYPAPTYYPQIPGPNGVAPEVPQYPPYIPEQDMNTSSGMPRSTLDGIHDDGGVVIKQPGELGPWSPPMEPPYTESPPGSGVWVPDHRPYPPGSMRPAAWSGKGAEEADAADAALRNTHEALNEADQGLSQNLTDAHTANAQSKMQLQRIHQEIRTGIAAMQPSLGTPAGREQLADFLQMKAAEAKQVASNAQQASTRLASSMRAVGQQFETASGPWGLGDDEWELNEWGQPQPIWPDGGGGGGAGSDASGGTAPI
jgi:hypothetical protein